MTQPAPRQRCRICDSDNLTPVIDLGPQLLASVTVTPLNKDIITKEAFPLEVVRCNSEKNTKACGLVQLSHTYPSKLIYREYWYRSGINQTMRDALQDVVRSSGRHVALLPNDVVVDIGCNDGTLLANYPNNLQRIGVDPVENIRGDNETFLRITDFFTADKILAAGKGQRAKVITSIAMFYDLEDPNRFVADISRILDPQGIWIVQFADLPEMLAGNMFDQIIHEHLEYYHFRPFQHLVEFHGLKVVDVEKNDVNGSSYRFYVRKAEGPDPDPAGRKRLADLATSEEKMGLETEAPYEQFRRNVHSIQQKLVDFVRGERKQGKTIVGYGASTKGNVLLQSCGLTEKDISFVADRNPRKWGGWTIGSNIPIISEEEARKMRPDYFLILPYYFFKESAQRERSYLEQGGKFIVPVPQLRIVTGSDTAS